jgi:hypothetical protein
LERLGKAIGTAVTRTAPRIEPVVREAETLPAGTRGISIGIDRTTVPMEEGRPAGTPPATRRKPRLKPYIRTAPPPVDVKSRMAYVGTVSLVDGAGEALITRRYAHPCQSAPRASATPFSRVAAVDYPANQLRLFFLALVNGEA